jgi:exodeoxyribonuclease VII small subunit
MSELKFDQALERLEKIVREMEGEGLPLEETLKKYEEGIKLARFCLSTLDKAEKKIEILIRDAEGGVSAQPFPGSGKSGSGDTSSESGTD